MHIAKLAAIAALVFHTLTPARNLWAWVSVSLFLMFILIWLSQTRLSALFFKNVPMFFFTAVFFIFMFFSSESLTRDRTLVLFKIALFFNVSLAASAWLGKGGLLFCVKIIRARRIKLFLLLLARSLAAFKRDARAAANQARLRLEPAGTRKLIIPKYYARNLVMKELYSFYHNQAALVSRMRGGAIPIYTQSAFNAKDMAAACAIIFFALLGVLLQSAM
jgi:hypothetical protein